MIYTIRFVIEARNLEDACKQADKAKGKFKKVSESSVIGQKVAR
jgi:hypothetical protein